MSAGASLLTTTDRSAKFLDSHDAFATGTPDRQLQLQGVIERHARTPWVVSRAASPVWRWTPSKDIPKRFNTAKLNCGKCGRRRQCPESVFNAAGSVQYYCN